VAMNALRLKRLRLPERPEREHTAEPVPVT
jgi:hypothetical protein